MSEVKVCDDCGRVIEDNHVCSEIIVGKEKEIYEMVKRERQTQVISELEKLELRDGDLLLFSYDRDIPVETVQENINVLNEVVKEYRSKVVPFIVLPSCFNLQVMGKSDLKDFIESAQAVYDEMGEE